MKHYTWYYPLKYLWSKNSQTSANKIKIILVGTLALERNKFKGISILINVPSPTLVGREELCTQMVFLLSQFWPIGIIIVESCAWCH